MTNISVKGVTPPPIEEPQEFCPVQLWKYARQNFRWNIETFAYVFGWEPSTIERWNSGHQKMSKKARIRAAELRKYWQDSYGLKI